jgi:hypothetical protein
MDFDDLMNQPPGDRLPLLTRGEADALVRLLGQLGGADEDVQRAGLELQARLAKRLPLA